MWLESIDGSEINMHYGKEPVLYLYIYYFCILAGAVTENIKFSLRMKACVESGCCTLWSPSTVTLSSAVHVYLIILSPPSGT